MVLIAVGQPRLIGVSSMETNLRSAFSQLVSMRC